jgi:hypothetical protein
MDQELLNVMIESLRRNSKESLIDQAFLQVGFLRKNGYDVVSRNGIKNLRVENQDLLLEIKELSISVKQLLDIIKRQKDRILSLEEENNFLKGTQG